MDKSLYIIKVIISLVLRIIMVIAKSKFKKCKDYSMFKDKHDLKSFEDGILFNFLGMIGANTLVMLIPIFEPMINEKFKILFNIAIFIYWILFISVTIYTITEVKHLSEFKEHKKIVKFLRVYVIYGLITLADLVFFIIRYISSLYNPFLEFSILAILLISLLGMADVLNNYKNEKLKCIKNVIRLFTSKEYRIKSKHQLSYNFRAIFNGVKVFISI